MQLPVMPPVSPMLAKSVKEIPRGDFSYEPKWDGFRSIIFRDGDEVEIGSRNEKPMTRYFPEVVEAVLANFPDRAVIDGEIIVIGGRGDRLDFETLQQRIHPAASRVTMLSERPRPASSAFDLLALGDDDYTDRPFAERRAALEQALGRREGPDPPDPGHPRPGGGPGLVQPVRGRGPGRGGGQAAGDRLPAGQAGDVQDQARAHRRLRGRRLPGAQERAGQHRLAAARSVQRRRRPDVGRRDRRVPAGPAQGAVHRAAADGDHLRRSSVGLGQAGGGHAYAAELRGQPWNVGKDLSFVPLRPELVVEVRYEHMEGIRFRHTAQFNRWRPDRDPRSCTYEQLEEPVNFDLADVLADA